MESIRRSKAPQGRPVENTRPALPYAQIPLALLLLPTGERAAAIEVWAVLHYHFRLGVTPGCITDRELLSAPWMADRSPEHARKGLEVLERSHLVSRHSRGSSRLLAIVARLKDARQAVRSRSIPVAPRGDGKTPLAPETPDTMIPQPEWAEKLRLLVSSDHQS